MLEEYDDLYEKPKRNKLGIVVAILLLLIAIFAVFAIKVAKEQQYQQMYDDAVYSMLDNCADVETLLNKHLAVWHDSIWEVDNPDTNEWTKDADGHFYEDFNDALNEFEKSNYFKSKMQSLSDKDYEIDQLMKELQNPPKKFSKAYDELVKYYGLYQGFVDLELLQGSYSYNELSEQFSKADDECIKQFYVVKAFTEY